jgi:hypothetical protein
LPIKEKMAARRLLSQTRMVLLDCPLSGTGLQAQTKDLVVYGSGPSAAFKKVKLVMEGFSRSQFYLGAFGNGMKLKMVDYDAKWANEYDSLYAGMALTDNGESLFHYPEMVVKNNSQQVVLSIHLIDKKTLGDEWVPTEESYDFL